MSDDVPAILSCLIMALLDFHNLGDMSQGEPAEGPITGEMPPLPVS